MSITGILTPAKPKMSFFLCQINVAEGVITTLDD